MVYSNKAVNYYDKTWVFNKYTRISTFGLSAAKPSGFEQFSALKNEKEKKDMFKSKKIIIFALVAVMLISIAGCSCGNSNTSRYSKDEKKQINDAVALIFDDLAEFSSEIFGDAAFLKGTQNAVIKSAEKADLEFNEALSLVNSVPQMIKILSMFIIASGSTGEPVYAVNEIDYYFTGYDDGYNDGYYDGYYGYSYYPNPYSEIDEYLEGYYNGYYSGYYAGQADASKYYYIGYEEILQIIEMLSEAVGDYESTGISGEKIALFTYNMLVEIKMPFANLLEENGGYVESFLEDYGKFMSCFTEYEFTLVFAACYNNGLTVSQSILNKDIFEMIADFAEYEALPTKAEFTALLKTKIDDAIKAYGYFTDNVYNVMGSILKKFNSKLAGYTGSLLAQQNQLIDDAVAVAKEVNKAMNAVLTELKADDYIFGVFYEILTTLADGETPDEAIADDLIIFLAKYANVALDNGINKTVIMDYLDILYANYYEYEVDDMISAIRELKNLQYGDSLEEYQDNIFVSLFI